ncbi:MULTISPECIES: hypothetical protein [unclassified Bacteroides]|jgi:hypothetical protein|uniref:hypothetical protein n=1 Tax=unclassified Bacteroides TaxID=2646097 RepID=UPI000E817C18|nr:MULTISPECIES: hypothetical protein [unclassified Bacteroides]RGN43795.1 hypothetical protein DXB63_15145 [Bacteroides sp. OM05-12]RHR73855.1 hypothetical protein DWW69_14450 [Bacteroides sp. AF16-49]
MLNKLLVNPKLINAIIEKVHDDNLPIIINIGESKDELVSVLFEYPDSFDENFNSLIDNTFNEVFSPIEL